MRSVLESEMAAWRSGPWRGAEVSAAGETGAMTSVVGGFWAAPGATSDVGGGVPTGAGCVGGGMSLTAPVSVAGVTRGERMEEALWLTGRGALYGNKRNVSSGKCCLG